MKFIHVSIKGLKEIFRDRRGLAFILAFPAIFMLVFGFAFGGGQGDNTPYRIGVVNKDRGAVISVPEEAEEKRNFGEELVGTLENLTFEDGDVPLFEVERVEDEEGDAMLKDREVAAVVTIPANFSDAAHQLIKSTVRKEVTGRVGEMIVTQFNDVSSREGENFGPGDFSPEGMDDISGGGDVRSLPEAGDVSAVITVKGDPGYMTYGRARGILTGVFGGFKEELVSQARKRTLSYFDEEYTSSGTFLEIGSESISGSQSLSAFDYQVPGIFVFALLMSAIGVAGSLAEEVESGTLERLKLSRMRSFDLLFGTLIPWSIMAVIQVLILFAIALLIGFNWVGGIASLGFAVLISVIAGVASVSLGLLIAAFAENEQQASNLGTLIAVPLSFIVGAFFPLPTLAIGRLFGSIFEIYDMLPWTHAADALRTLLIYGGGFGEVVVDVVLLVGLTVLLFFASVYFFSRTRLSTLE
ncbi:MAG: ABC transporter permease [Candidatus Bipolaricaulota bacterium]|nr:ABC transporter permease [Candidatus Bipolaricaulota bacterium]MBS3792432.1 ABC transporter permease [Candidatus Bipolaricaulota bacterium]